MKNYKRLRLFTVLFTIFLSFSSWSQSISGNMNSGNIASLGYGNVDIYKGKEKVASVLTDHLGNFNVKLDTGYYRVEFKYEGHDKLVKNIRVTGDEKDDFALAKKDGYVAPRYDLPKTESIESYSYSKEERMMFGDAMEEVAETKSIRKSPPRISKPSITSLDVPKSEDYKSIEGSSRSGSLTAGEINDFAKWEMWNDIAENELSVYKQKWDLSFSERYTVQLKNADGYPIVDALVQLLDENKAVSYESRTDNTGKAELWGKLGINDIWSNTASAIVSYKGETHTIRRLTTFQNGVNSLTINAECGASDVVDIAFVVDATGSMGDEINYLKDELNHVIFKSKNDHPELTFNFGNVFYRDHTDEYVTRRHDFTDVLSSSIDFINQQSAAGGGDYEEAVELAMNEAIDSLKWSENARTRIMFLVLDAPPHNNPQIRQELKVIARKAASKGIRIVPLAASGIQKDTEYLMRCFALGSNGTYAFLTNHSGIGGSHIEPSTDEYKVELLNDLMVRIIDTYSFVEDCEEETTIEEEENPFASDTLISIEWNIWPNPTQGDLNIKIGADINEMFVTDITGKIMNRFTDLKKNRVLKTNIAQYARGIYLVTFIHEDKKYTKKVVLQ
ncbi:T9SS type A sorting domain-containing protein [Brumimicrobium mesophilum]|uniref:T9SS type A sorting domain-containing protein n=1 Tax=Brumimicrobium mesophilum TaxID=392717 RepID=UPI000D142806|nr:T9SS type A sorting domain-containing protein [Brumimicrobium mesophilum]